MTASAEPTEFFQQVGALALTDAQLSVALRFRGVLQRLSLAYLTEDGTRAILDEDGALMLEMWHGQDRDVQVGARIDSYGRVDLSCESLRPGFSICFNDKWEPDDCLGDLDAAAEVLEGLLEGRVVSEILWGGSAIAVATDVLIRDDGTREKLDRELRIAGMVGSVVARRRTVSRVSFADAR